MSSYMLAPHQARKLCPDWLPHVGNEYVLPSGAKVKVIGEHYWLCGYAQDGSDVFNTLASAKIEPMPVWRFYEGGSDRPYSCDRRAVCVEGARAIAKDNSLFGERVVKIKRGIDCDGSQCWIAVVREAKTK